jgi:5'-3' exonuclease
LKYRAILIDALNLLYRLREQHNEASKVSSKYVYRELVIRFIAFMDALQEEYLATDGQVFYLFDHSPSNHDHGRSYRNIGRKAIDSRYKENRQRDSKEFYNTFDLIKYYYLTNKPHYVSLQAQGYEADDLVRPIIKHVLPAKSRVLMVTNDYDWTRYLTDTVDWLPKLGQKPATIQDYIEEKGYKPTEQSVLIYKAVFGDKSDNIAGLLPESPKHVDELIEILADESVTTDTMIHRSFKSELLKVSPIYRAIHENEKQFRINIQLIEPVKIDERHLESIMCVGRNSEVATAAVETAIGLRKEERVFVFGNIKT